MSRACYSQSWAITKERRELRPCSEGWHIHAFPDRLHTIIADIEEDEGRRRYLRAHYFLIGSGLAFLAASTVIAGIAAWYSLNR